MTLCEAEVSVVVGFLSLLAPCGVRFHSRISWLSKRSRRGLKEGEE